MQNIKTPQFDVDIDTASEIITKARVNDRKHLSRAVSSRLVELALHIHQQGLSGAEAAELIRCEAENYRKEAQELH